MKRKIAIYLAGAIRKGHEKSEPFYWTDDDILFLKESLPHFEISFLNPAFRTDDLSDQVSVFGRDMLQIFSCDILFVDARDRRGLGVGAEMMWAKVNKIPVVTWAPKNSHYHKDEAVILDVRVPNFVHPFVEGLSDKIVESLEEGAAWIGSFMTGLSPEIKGIECVEGAMKIYKERQLERDIPMRELVESSTELYDRIYRRSLTIQSF